MLADYVQLKEESEAAQYLRRSVRTLQYWRYVGGGPPYVKNGRRVFYRQQDLDAFIEAGLRTSTSDTGSRNCARLHHGRRLS